jgi:hypothetical protein
MLLFCAGHVAAQTQTSKPEFFGDQVAVNLPHLGVDVPGFARKMHVHQFNRVMIYMHPGGETLHYADGHTDVLKWQTGTAVWSPIAGFHYSDIPTSTLPLSSPMIIELNIIKDGDPKKVVSSDLDGVRVDPNDFKLEIDNTQVRVIRLKIAPHQSVPMHEHVLNYMVVPITDENLRETSADGKSEVIQRKAGEYAWRGPAKCSIENLGDKPFEAVIVEIKN